MVVGFTNMQSVHITTKVVSSKPVHGDLYSIQYYVIKFVSEILLKVALNTITLTVTQTLYL
jgi:hypothetical protein